MVFIDILDRKYHSFKLEEDFHQLKRCLSLITYGDLDILCLNDIQGERQASEVNEKGLFHMDEFIFPICNILVNFSKQIYNIKEKKELRYTNGCALIRHFKHSLVF